MRPQKPRPAVPTLQEADAARNTSDVDMDEQLLIDLVGGDSLPNVPLPYVPLPNVPRPKVPLPNVPLPQACPDGSAVEECSSSPIAEQVIVVVFM
jgi:hypothetical protein